MMIFFLYLPILLSLSLSVLLHVFKKHIHLFLLNLVTTLCTSSAIYNMKLHPHSSTSTTIHVLGSPPLPKQIGFVNDIGKEIEGLVTCTKSLDFKSIDINDEIDDNDHNDNNNQNEDDCWRKMRVAEGRGNFPPPLSSMNGNGQSSFVLVPVRTNGRLQLRKTRIKRPKILYSNRQDGRLRLFLVPDECVEDDVEEDEEDGELVDDIEEQIEEEEEEELIMKPTKEEEELIMEPTKEEEKLIMAPMEEDDELGEEITSYDMNKDVVRFVEWKFPKEMFRKCHEVVNHIPRHHHVHGSHHNLCLNIYGLGIA
ncbi:hypothetical protein Fmac_024519 [Flemingia macrophylla]|uniref:FAF domain-containing protein n=1 Tax=Flemingia macrophylla TaxID=520843 RepID=A0ABD1LPQ7_9FABA